MKIKILKQCAVGGESRLVDEQMTVSEKDGKYLIAIGKAELAKETTKEPAKTKPAKREK